MFETKHIGDFLIDCESLNCSNAAIHVALAMANSQQIEKGSFPLSKPPVRSGVTRCNIGEGE